MKARATLAAVAAALAVAAPAAAYPGPGIPTARFLVSTSVEVVWLNAGSVGEYGITKCTRPRRAVFCDAYFDTDSQRCFWHTKVKGWANDQIEHISATVVNEYCTERKA